MFSHDNDYDQSDPEDISAGQWCYRYVSAPGYFNVTRHERRSLCLRRMCDVIY
jgi:hypothetical protein